MVLKRMAPVVATRAPPAIAEDFGRMTKVRRPKIRSRTHRLERPRAKYLLDMGFDVGPTRAVGDTACPLLSPSEIDSGRVNMRLVVGLVVGALIGFGAATWFYGNGGSLIVLGTEWGASPGAAADRPRAPGFTTEPLTPDFTGKPLTPDFTGKPLGPDFTGKPLEPDFTGSPLGPHATGKPLEGFTGSPAGPDYAVPLFVIVWPKR
jgi:hypothetical protein